MTRDFATGLRRHPPLSLTQHTDTICPLAHIINARYLIYEHPTCTYTALYDDPRTRSVRQARLGHFSSSLSLEEITRRWASRTVASPAGEVRGGKRLRCFSFPYSLGGDVIIHPLGRARHKKKGVALSRSAAAGFGSSPNASNNLSKDKMSRTEKKRCVKEERSV